MKLISLIILSLMLASSSVYADDFSNGKRAYHQGDYAKAIKILEPLGLKGHAEAQYHLGLMYSDGHGVSQDYREAMKWFRKSAEQEYGLAQNNLGLMYLNGFGGVSKNYKEAIKWFRKAAEQGDASAQYNLGNRYFAGQGVDKDFGEAHKWWIIASANGHMQARIERDDIEKQMTSEQIAHSQSMAKVWFQTHEKK